MKRILFIIILIAIAIVTYRYANHQDDYLNLPFNQDDISSIEAYYLNTQNDSQKKLVIDSKSIGEIYSLFDNKIIIKAKDETTDAEKIAFRFILTNGKNFVLSYKPYQVKKGYLYIDGECYEFQSDIRGKYKDLDYPENKISEEEYLEIMKR